MLTKTKTTKRYQQPPFEYARETLVRVEEPSQRVDKLTRAQKVGLKAGASVLALAAIGVGGSAYLNRSNNDPGQSDKTVQVAHPEVAKPGEFQLTAEQKQRVNETARKTTLTLFNQVKGPGKDQYNGYGQLLVTQEDPSNKYGQAMWVRGYETPDGTEFNVELVGFTSPDGKLGNDAIKILSGRSLNFINPDTEVFKDGKLTSDEVKQVFSDSNTVLQGGTRDVENIENQAGKVTFGADGSIVVGKGEKFELKTGKDDYEPLPPAKDIEEAKLMIGWIVNPQ